MNSFNLFTKLKSAYERSTINNNIFERVIESIMWDSMFYVNSEYYFVKDNLILTTTSLNPFEMLWPPEVLFKDGTLFIF